MTGIYSLKSYAVIESKTSIFALKAYAIIEQQPPHSWRITDDKLHLDGNKSEVIGSRNVKVRVTDSKGHQLTKTLSIIVADPADAFGPDDWQAVNGGAGGEIKIEVWTLPADGGSPITALQYQLNGGAWTALGGKTPGVYRIQGLTNNVAVNVAIRAVTAAGPGAASVIKPVTPKVASGNQVAIAFAQAQTTTGTQDITADDLGGKTPKAALIYWVSSTVDGSVASSPAGFGCGAVAGGGEWAFGTYRNGTSSARQGAANACVLMINTTAVNGRASFVSFIPGGIRIDWTVAASAARRMMVVLFAGDDLTAKAGVTPISTGGGTAVATGFKPDFVFLGSPNTTFNDTLGGNSRCSIGVSAFNGVGYDQRCTFRHAQLAQNSRTRSPVGFAGGSTGAGSTLTYHVSANNFSSAGFSVVSSASSTDGFGYLAISYGGKANVEVGSWRLPTATGSASKTGLAFRPDAVLLGMFIDVNDTIATWGDIGAAAITGLRCGSLNFTNSDTGGTERSVFSSSSLMQATSTALQVDATLVSMDSHGWTFNFTTATGVKDWWYVAVKFD